MREVVAEFERPVLLFSGRQGLDRHAADCGEGVLPVAGPVPADARRHGPQLPGSDGVSRPPSRGTRRSGSIVASVEDAIAQGWSADPVGPRASRNQIQTVPLLHAIQAHRFDAVFGGARRDEEKARAKERVFSFRDEFGQWDPKNQRPELWSLFNGRHRKGEHIRVFPLSNWTEVDIWQYIAREQVALPSIYYRHAARGLSPRRHAHGGDAGHAAAARRAGVPDGCALSHSGRHDLHGRRRIRRRSPSSRSSKRWRPAGLPNAVPPVPIDRASEAAMEDRKREGYF